jgi:5-hydroxyisourate hydrolase/2-oxo-4-hydroxy-4-carboxy-5-ureidoimidazoline decarboxylase
MITISQLNSLSKKEAFNALNQCCVSTQWISQMVESRPFSSSKELIEKAADIWYENCGIEDFKEAFTGHPKIGNLESLKAKFADTATWAGNEQAKIEEATQETIEALAEANTLYEAKFGYIFIVSASKKSAEHMLAIVNARLHHNAENEIYVAMNEQHKITVIRLGKLIDGLLQESDTNSHITTHSLDTSIGVPAKNMVIILKEKQDDNWQSLSLGITNKDGRIADLLPPGKFLKPGFYTMQFHTEKYYKENNIKGFYPEVSIQFEVTDASHYHIPLLINPFGYSTYRGS